jgi:hypothetical protein
VTGGAPALDAGATAGAAAPRPAQDAGARTDAATPTPNPPQGEQLVSGLTASQIYALCTDVDHRLGLIGDIDAACRVEAWLSSMSEDGCNAVLADCSASGESGLGLERGSPCAERTLPECNATVAATLACADDNGAFFQARTCAQANLREAPPACNDTLAELCPALFERN